MTTTIDPRTLALTAAKVAEQTGAQKVRLESSEKEDGRTTTQAAEITSPKTAQVKPQTDTFQSAAQHVLHRGNTSPTITVSTSGANKGSQGGIMVSFNSGSSSGASSGHPKQITGEKSLFNFSISA